MLDEPTTIPVWALVHLAHAALQDAAETAGADILHIKGPTLGTNLQPERHDSSDADVLVRPDHLDRFLDVLTQRGWSEFSGFHEGSAFEHAANYRHPHLGYADVHRLLPGPHASPTVVFEALWRNRTGTMIAHRECTVPDEAGQVFVQVLHAARSHGAEGPTTWDAATREVQDGAERLSAELESRVAFAAGLGRLDEFRGTPDYYVWRYWSGTDANRLAEWGARWRAASGIRGRLHVAWSALHVNRTHLRMRLGHEPTTSEIVREQWSRLGKLYSSMKHWRTSQTRNAGADRKD
ncbi:MAG: nucleotidyltransferase family protein [Microbacteriaceae bacterium]